MSLYKRGDSWQCRIVHKGEKFQKRLGRISKTEARAAEAIWKVEIMRGEAVPTKVPTLSDFSTQFLNYLPSRVKPGSFRLYTTCWVHLANSPLARLRLSEISRSVVDRFAQEKLASGLAVITVNSILRTLRRALLLAHEWELISKRPVVKLLPNENRRTFVVDEATEARLVAHFGQHDLMRHIIPFACDTGLRAGEIAALKWADVVLTDNPSVTVRDGKTRSLAGPFH